MSHHGLRLLHYDGKPVLVWLHGLLPHLETEHLARLMGYVQPGSIRKQMFSDWKGYLLHDEDYIIVRDEGELRAYEQQERLHNGIDKAANVVRGRVFLTASGVGKVLRRSTKTTWEFETFVGLKVFFGDDISEAFSRGQEGDVFDDSSTSEEEDPAQRVSDAPIPSTGTSPTSSTSATSSSSEAEGDRKFQYEAIQKLLHNLKEHQEPVLRALAIEAAELALGRRLDDIRSKFLGQKKPAPPPRQTDGPLFEEEGWYSFKQMGELAGGYSASYAGKAATIVAERWGFTGEKIRRQQLHFNTFVTKEINGRPRTWPQFNRAFANEVVCELRSNELLTPKPSPSAEAQLGRRREYPKLTKGPFDEEDEGVSDNMESFLETLEGERPTH